MFNTPCNICPTPKQNNNNNDKNSNTKHISVSSQRDKKSYFEQTDVFVFFCSSFVSAPTKAKSYRLNNNFKDEFMIKNFMNSFECIYIKFVFYSMGKRMNHATFICNFVAIKFQHFCVFMYCILYIY